MEYVQSLKKKPLTTSSIPVYHKSMFSDKKANKNLSKLSFILTKKDSIFSHKIDIIFLEKWWK